MLLRAFHDGGRWYVFPCLFPHRIVVRAGCKGGAWRRENERGIVGFVSGVVPIWNGTPSATRPGNRSSGMERRALLGRTAEAAVSTWFAVTAGASAHAAPTVAWR